MLSRGRSFTAEFGVEASVVSWWIRRSDQQDIDRDLLKICELCNVEEQAAVAWESLEAVWYAAHRGSAQLQVHTRVGLSPKLPGRDSQKLYNTVYCNSI
jgi:hypothetical protein